MAEEREDAPSERNFGLWSGEIAASALGAGLGESWIYVKLGAGPTGVGKSYLASALAQKACRDGYAVYYTRAAALFRELNLARADSSLQQLLRRLNRIDVLVVDDWAMAPMTEPERRDFWEIAEDRYQTRSIVLTSQLPVSRWHEQIGDPTLADSILDRLVHNAHRIEMRRESMRKHRGAGGEK